VGLKAFLDTVIKSKIPSPSRESKPRTPIVQSVAQRYTELVVVTMMMMMIIIGWGGGDFHVMT
jgi:hypothetical protein